MPLAVHLGHAACLHCVPSLAQAALASGVVDAVLIPEARFELEGERGLLKYVEGVLAKKGHAVVCIAEGAAQVSLVPICWGWGGVVSDDAGSAGGSERASDAVMLLMP
jgi:hypothetical protein